VTTEPWSEFSRDPRVADHASLRASDADRDVVARVLGDAYAEGRIDPAELDERTTALQHARTLGELPGFLGDLVPVGDARAPASSPALLEQRAVEKWRKERRDALWGLVSVSAIVWTIWLVGAWGDDGFDPHFPWPAFVTLAALLNLGRTQVQRADIVAEERRRLEKKERKALERRPPDDDQG
jgi:hypothetical protein